MTATTLKMKIVEIAYAISAWVASTIPATAAIADAPQMPVPTPTSVRRRGETRKAPPMTAAPASATASVPSITGSDFAPTRRICPSASVLPSRTIASWRSTVEEKAMPGAARGEGRRTSERAIPRRIASTGAPSSGTTCDRPHAGRATATVHASPGPTARGLHFVTNRD